MHRRFLNGTDEILAANGDAFRPGRFPATLVLGDCLIDQTPVMFLEGFQIRIAQRAQTGLLVGQNVALDAGPSIPDNCTTATVPDAAPHRREPCSARYRPCTWTDVVPARSSCSDTGLPKMIPNAFSGGCTLARAMTAMGQVIQFSREKVAVGSGHAGSIVEWLGSYSEKQASKNGCKR